MRSAKSLILAMAIAFVVPGLFGTSSAFATELCSTNTDPCSGTKYGTKTSIEATLSEGTKVTMSTSVVTVTCAQATMKGETTNGGGEEEAVTGTMSTISFANCETSGGTACTVETKNLPYQLEIGPGDAGNGVLYLKDETGIAAKVKCGFIINCTFETEEKELALEVTGGNPASADVEKSPLEGTGLICPATSTLTAKFQINQPSPVFTVNRWLRPSFEPFDFLSVTVNTLKTQKIKFRYVGGNQTDLLSAFVTNVGGEAAFKVNILNGNPDEDCKKRIVHGQECFVVVHFEPKTTGDKEAKISIDDQRTDRHFEMTVKGKGVP